MLKEAEASYKKGLELAPQDAALLDSMKIVPSIRKSITKNHPHSKDTLPNCPKQ